MPQRHFSLNFIISFDYFRAKISTLKKDWVESKFKIPIVSKIKKGSSVIKDLFTAYNYNRLAIKPLRHWTVIYVSKTHWLGVDVRKFNTINQRHNIFHDSHAAYFFINIHFVAI